MAGIIKPFYSETLKHLYNLFTDREYRTYSFLESRLRRVPRFKECSANVHGWNLRIPDSASFLSAYEEIFVNKIYAFKTDNPKPRILDLGANIGLSVLYFKSVYPGAMITAFEADPNIFEYLKHNIQENGFTDVELENCAAWNENAEIEFDCEGADGGHVASSVRGEKIIEVKAIDIGEYLKDKKFDFLKMDIEGAENIVLPRCEKYLSDIKFLFIEFHSRVGEKQSLSDIVGIMERSGFRIYIQNALGDNVPFIERIINSGIDLQLNIFGWKK